MIKLNVNNRMSIEISQEFEDRKINVDVLNSNGKLDYYYTISPEDMVMLLNEYQYKNNII